MTDTMTTGSLPAPNSTPGRYPLPPAPPPEAASGSGSSEAAAQWNDILDGRSRGTPEAYLRALELAERDLGTLPAAHAAELARMRGGTPGGQQQGQSASSPAPEPSSYHSLNVPAILAGVGGHDMTPAEIAEADGDLRNLLSAMAFEDKTGASFVRSAIETAVVWSNMDATAQQQHMAEVQRDLKGLYGDRLPEMLRVADAVAARGDPETIKQMAEAGYFQSARAVVALINQGRKLGL